MDRKGVGIGSVVPRPASPPKPPTRAAAFDDEMPELTPEQKDELRQMLETRRTELVSSIETRQEQERDTGREVGDEMDEANIEGATAMASRLLERDVQLLSEIDRALGKFRENAYGLCEGTGEPIGYARLKSRPWARFSVSYQEQLERDARTRGGI
jgi:DnaK suppressor protein